MTKSDNSDEVDDPLEARPDVWYALGDEYKNNYAVELHDEIKYYKTRRGAENRIRKEYDLDPSQDQETYRKRSKDMKGPISNKNENKNDLLNGSL